MRKFQLMKVLEGLVLAHRYFLKGEGGILLSHRDFQGLKPMDFGGTGLNYGFIVTSLSLLIPSNLPQEY